MGHQLPLLHTWMYSTFNLASGPNTCSRRKKCTWHKPSTWFGIMVSFTKWNTRSQKIRASWWNLTNHSERTFRVDDYEEKSGYHPIVAVMPQGSALGPLLYLLNTVHIPLTGGTRMATFAYDTVITAVSESQPCSKQWKIKLHPQKTIHATFALQNIDPNFA